MTYGRKYPIYVKGMSKKKKLDSGDIEKIVSKIRGLYNDFIIRFTKPLTLKEKFEFRYHEALAASMDMETFLQAEAEAILTLFAREEEKIRQEEEGPPRVAPPRTMSQIADDILLENRRKIAKYPDLPIHAEASYEVKKMFGALKLLDEFHWPNLDNVLRVHSREFPARTRPVMQAKITDLCTIRLGGVPLVLGRYQHLLRDYEHNIREIEQEEQRLLLEASFLLHNLADVHRTALGIEHLSEEFKERVETGLDYVDNVIKDFRLNQLKPKTT